VVDQTTASIGYGLSHDLVVLMDRARADVDWHLWLNGASALLALCAAVLWFLSARVQIPGMTYGEPSENPMHIALRSAAKLNSHAATCAGLAALLQAAASTLR
jgi:hypothetical protein